MVKFKTGDSVRHKFQRHLSGGCLISVSKVDEASQMAEVEYFDVSVEGKPNRSKWFPFSELELVHPASE